MKRFAIIGCLVVCALFLATQVMADTFSVTANFGVRVTEKGKCEQVGSITLTPQGGASGTSFFRANTIIRIELLAGAKVCKAIGANYTYGPITPGGTNYVGTTGGDYRIVGVVGDDFYTISVYNAGALGTEQLIVGHDANSPLCFNLENTPYKPDTPQNQLVQVSYKDDRNNTYSGDPYVATVKPNAHVVATCAKTETGADASTTAWGVRFLTNKDTLPSIPLCLTTTTNAQTQSTACAGGVGTVCIKVTDPDNVFQLDARYDFSIGRIPPKTGVLTGIGIQSATLWRKTTAGAWESRAFTITNRYNTAGTIVSGLEATKTAKIDGYTTMLGSGVHYIILTIAYDCTATFATPATWAIDLSASRNPCGDSFTKEDLAVVNFTSCTGGAVTTFEAVFPYSPNTDKEWWSGLALTNTSDAEATIDLTIYEADGDKYTASVIVPARGIKLGLLSDTNFISPVAAGTDAKFGDEPFWVMAKSSKKFSGFIMMGNGKEAQGNMPLQNWGYGSSW